MFVSPGAAAYPSSAAEVAARRKLALVQHERVLQEAAEVDRLAAQARNRRQATPVFGSVDGYEPAVRARVNWERAG